MVSAAQRARKEAVIKVLSCSSLGQPASTTSSSSAVDAQSNRPAGAKHVSCALPRITEEVEPRTMDVVVQPSGRPSGAWQVMETLLWDGIETDDMPSEGTKPRSLTGSSLLNQPPGSDFSYVQPTYEYGRWPHQHLSSTQTIA